MIITIDGFIATGKSTIAKQLAKELGFVHFDTGAMYRGLTYAILKKHIDPDDTEAIIAFLPSFEFKINLRHEERRYYVNGDDVTEALRGEEVTDLVSQISAIPEVRKQLVAMQRELSKGINAVYEGRDMGTEVFPDAQLKIFLTGSTEVRAKRRFNEIKEKYPNAYKELSLEKTIESISQRDEYDTKREISPLRQAKDACVIDTTDFTLEEVIIKILEFKDRLKTE